MPRQSSRNLDILGPHFRFLPTPCTDARRRHQLKRGTSGTLPYSVSVVGVYLGAWRASASQAIKVKDSPVLLRKTIVSSMPSAAPPSVHSSKDKPATTLNRSSHQPGPSPRTCARPSRTPELTAPTSSPSQPASLSQLFPNPTLDTLLLPALESPTLYPHHLDVSAAISKPAHQSAPRQSPGDP
ncbi:uncharacterized protein B0I36DRAFT_27908 [Microdochium trichocladiopsis]|uniref:Uncharacterized protein n=1 Tax=Microdochium trichocladiopsis TaxID=1682393 RepID=A0A9P8XX66_9PEZI|nr:uncharacterized protein B0I36DRAFT_27908 [Microdochium trichocladiopsis]KAH7021017.1 hypothetical protein B0I36DRAFT_27908 [Microdochium trichocladiopsis]